MLARVWTNATPRRLLLAAFALAVLFRIPLAVAPVGPDSDMVRYLWDGRVQLLGYNPYAVVPADPAMAIRTRTQTARMPSRRDRTPYPPAAQLFFRLVWRSRFDAGDEARARPLRSAHHGRAVAMAGGDQPL